MPYKDLLQTSKKFKTFKPERTARLPRLTEAQKTRRKQYFTAFTGQETTPEQNFNYIILNPGERLSPYGYNYQEALELGLIDPTQSHNWADYGMTVPGFWSRTVSGPKTFGPGSLDPKTRSVLDVSKTFGPKAPGPGVQNPLVSKTFGPGMTIPKTGFPVTGGRSMTVSGTISKNFLRPSASPGIWKKFLKGVQKTWEYTSAIRNATGTAFVTVGRGAKRAGLAVYDMATGTAYPKFMTFGPKTFGPGLPGNPKALGPGVSPKTRSVLGEQYNPFIQSKELRLRKNVLEDVKTFGPGSHGDPKAPGPGVSPKTRGVLDVSHPKTFGPGSHGDPKTRGVLDVSHPKTFGPGSHGDPKRQAAIASLERRLSAQRKLRPQRIILEEAIAERKKNKVDDMSFKFFELSGYIFKVDKAIKVFKNTLLNRKIRSVNRIRVEDLLIKSEVLLEYLKIKESFAWTNYELYNNNQLNIEEVLKPLNDAISEYKKISPTLNFAF